MARRAQGLGSAGSAISAAGCVAGAADRAWPGCLQLSWACRPPELWWIQWPGYSRQQLVVPPSLDGPSGNDKCGGCLSQELWSLQFTEEAVKAAESIVSECLRIKFHHILNEDVLDRLWF